MCMSGIVSKEINKNYLFHFRAVKDLRWLAEATYTGEALLYSLNNMINKLVTERSVVIVLTDGRSDTIRDTVPLNVLCGKGLKVKRNSENIGFLKKTFLKFGKTLKNIPTHTVQLQFPVEINTTYSKTPTFYFYSHKLSWLSVNRDWFLHSYLRKTTYYLKVLLP